MKSEAIQNLEKVFLFRISSIFEMLTEVLGYQFWKFILDCTIVTDI